MSTDRMIQSLRLCFSAFFIIGMTIKQPPNGLSVRGCFTFTGLCKSQSLLLSYGIIDNGINAAFVLHVVPIDVPVELRMLRVIG